MYEDDPNCIVKINEANIYNKIHVEHAQKRFIAFDTETTGLNCINDRIVEIGAVLYEDGKEVKRFSSLIKTGVPMGKKASEINGITDEMLADAPEEAEVYKDFIEWLGPATQGRICLVGHNAIFDMNFLQATLIRLNIPATFYFMDTLAFSKAKIQTGIINFKQDSVAAYFGIVNEKSHRAVTDADTCGKIFLALCDKPW